MAIQLGYNNVNTDYSDLRWIQTVRTDKPNGNNRTYTDPVPNEDNLPFYWTDKEQPKYTGVSGYDYFFKDAPYRRESNVYWHGELSLVGQKNGQYSIITTFDYGFSVTNGKLQIEPLVFGKPSFFTLCTLWNYNYYSNLLSW